MLGGLDGQLVPFGVLDGDVASQGQVAHGGDAIHVRGHGGDGHLEADLIIALAGAAVGDGRGPELSGSLDQVLGDDGTGQGRDQRIRAPVQTIGLERGHAVLLGELLARVRHVGLDGAAVQRSSADDVEILSTLTDIDGDRDNLSARLLADPADGHGGVETPGVGEDNAVLVNTHVSSLF